jgi:hypothetical protein
MMKLPLSFLLLSLSIGYADVYVENKMLGGMTMKTWTSHLKQRTETPNPMFGGSMVTITRVDKGVEWQLDLKRKIYEEKPIALPYTKEKMPATKDSPSFEEKTEKIEIKKTSKTRPIAGFNAEGYEFLVDNKSQGILWNAPLTGVLEKANQEVTAYHEAHSKKMFENYPATERMEMAAGMAMIQQFLKTSPKGIGDLPKGFTLGMQGGAGMEMPQMGDGLIFEVTSVKVDSVDSQLFNIPDGFTKVPSISQASMGDMMNPEKMQEMMKDMDMEKMMKELQKQGIPTE